MSQSTDGSTLRSLRQEHIQLVTAINKDLSRAIKIPSLPSTNRATNIAWLKKAIRGLKAQVDTKTTKKKPPKSNIVHKGKWTEKTALQFIDSFEQNYDAQAVKNIEKLRKSKSKRSIKTVLKYNGQKELYDFLRKEFGI